MKAEGGYPNATLILSERNVLTLLTKLYTPGSACEIAGDPIDAPINVRVETDAKHYADRPTPPGPMHPTTERILQAVREVTVGEQITPMRTVGQVLAGEIAERISETIVNAANAVVDEYNAPHDGRTERDEAMGPCVAKLGVALAILDAQTGSQTPQTAES